MYIEHGDIRPRLRASFQKKCIYRKEYVMVYNYKMTVLTDCCANWLLYEQGTALWIKAVDPKVRSSEQLGSVKQGMGFHKILMS